MSSQCCGRCKRGWGCISLWTAVTQDRDVAACYSLRLVPCPCTAVRSSPSQPDQCDTWSDQKGPGLWIYSAEEEQRGKISALCVCVFHYLFPCINLIARESHSWVSPVRWHACVWVYISQTVSTCLPHRDKSANPYKINQWRLGSRSGSCFCLG